MYEGNWCNDGVDLCTCWLSTFGNVFGAPEGSFVYLWNNSEFNWTFVEITCRIVVNKFPQYVPLKFVFQKKRQLTNIGQNTSRIDPARWNWHTSSRFVNTVPDQALSPNSANMLWRGLRSVWREWLSRAQKCESNVARANAHFWIEGMFDYNNQLLFAWLKVFIIFFKFIRDIDPSPVYAPKSSSSSSSSSPTATGNVSTNFVDIFAVLNSRLISPLVQMHDITWSNVYRFEFSHEFGYLRLSDAARRKVC